MKMTPVRLHHSERVRIFLGGELPYGLTLTPIRIGLYSTMQMCSFYIMFDSDSDSDVDK